MPPRRTARILIVDDDPLLLELLTDTLTAIGHETVPAGDGAIALDILQTEQFDLMITDIKMPNVDGLQLLKKVRRHYPKMPVLFITGVASREVIGQAEPDGFLAKPFRITHIEEMIEQTLTRKERTGFDHRHELLVVNGAGRLADQFVEGLSAQGFGLFTYTNVDEAVRELDNNKFMAILADIAPWSVRPVDALTRLRQHAPITPLILNADIFPSDAHDRVAREFELAGFVAAPFALPQVTALLNSLTIIPAER